MAKTYRDQDIKYLNRDFNSLKRDLIEYSQAHHSGVLQDLNESSPGMAIMDYQAYVGDILSYYQDFQFNELRRETARQIENVASTAKSLGYRPSGKRAARGIQSFIIEVPAASSNGVLQPNESYCPILRKGSQCQGPNGVYFETLEDLDFSKNTTLSPRMVTGSQFNSLTGDPSHFAIRKDVQVSAGQTKTQDFTITSFQSFKTIEISDEDVIEIIEVTDSEGNDWTEVDYLAQDTVFDYTVNSESDSTDVPYILRIVPVSRRFIVDYDSLTAKTSLIFGSGDGLSFDDELIPDAADLALPLAGRRNFTSVAIDPQNFLKTTSLGLSPFNTTITVTYRVGGGLETNAPPKSIVTVSEATLDFSSTSLDPIVKSSIIGSIDCVNVSRMEGGLPAESVTEIKANSSAFFAAQNRVVTKEDYIARTLSMPAAFGTPYKVYVKKNQFGDGAIDLHVLSMDSNGLLTTASANLKRNIQSYISKFRMLTDGVNILDADIINLKCKFGVVVSNKLSRSEVLTKCLSVVRDYLKTNNMQIGQPIILTDLLSQIQSVIGVISVYDLVFTNVYGTIDSLSYNSSRFDVSPNIKNQILYCPDNSIFEIRHPVKDIVGVAK